MTDNTNILNQVVNQYRVASAQAKIIIDIAESNIKLLTCPVVSQFEI